VGSFQGPDSKQTHSTPGEVTTNGRTIKAGVNFWQCNTTIVACEAFMPSNRTEKSDGTEVNEPPTSTVAMSADVDAL
jgi:hypothetical protein